VEGILREESDDPSVVSEALNFSAFLAAARGEYSRAWQLSRASHQLCSELGRPAVAAAAFAQVGFEIARREGDLTAAESGLRAGDETLAEAGEEFARSTVLAMLAHVLVERGEAAEAQDRVDLAQRLTQPGDLWSEVLWRTARAKVLSLGGNPEDAEALAEEAVRLAAASDWLCLHGDALLDLADIQERAGRLGRATASVEAALALYDEKADLASATRARTRLHRLAPPPQ
jgi:tetratricopeptide (TPR) repeat protein